MSVIALIPARAGSKGIPGKNLRTLGGTTLIQHAVDCACAVGVDVAVVSTDIEPLFKYRDTSSRITLSATRPTVQYLRRPADLASDTAAMVDVVKHAMAEIKGQPEDVWILLQPTAVFRKPEHIQQAIALLQESGADSVVSVVELPKTHHPHMQIEERAGRLYPFYQGTDHEVDDDSPKHWARRAEHWSPRVLGLPSSRQECGPTYIRDGTCYAFRRSTVERHGNIYGQDVRPLVIDPADSCELDTEADWLEVERRWKERDGA